MREIKHLSVHQWLRSAIPDSQQPTSPIGFLFLKLPPPPCAVLLVDLHPSESSRCSFETPPTTNDLLCCWQDCEVAESTQSLSLPIPCSALDCHLMLNPARHPKSPASQLHRRSARNHDFFNLSAQVIH